MTTISANISGFFETVDTTGMLQFQTANTTALTIDTGQNVICNGTGAIILPTGNTAQRPTGINGTMRYNTTAHLIESYVNGNWAAMTGSYTFSASYL